MSLICPHLYAPCLCGARLHQVGASGPRKFSTDSEALALSLLALVGGHMDLNANAHREESRRVTKGGALSLQRLMLVLSVFLDGKPW